MDWSRVAEAAGKTYGKFNKKALQEAAEDRMYENAVKSANLHAQRTRDRLDESATVENLARASLFRRQADKIAITQDGEAKGELKSHVDKPGYKKEGYIRGTRRLGSGNWRTGKQEDQEVWENRYGGVVGEGYGIASWADDLVRNILSGGGAQP